MTARRLATGGEIDRSKPLAFTFDGQRFSGFAGDTLASALLANDVPVVGRSFKYHRPRGIFAAGVEEPNAILDLRDGARHDPNARATLVALAEGMALASVHAKGTALKDRLSWIDRFSRFIPAAFYYKTFIWPRWHLFEGRIRALAGLGRLDKSARSKGAPARYLQADCCVIGAGPAGLAAALAASTAGKRVLLVEQVDRLGGSLLSRAAEIDGQSATAWLLKARERLAAQGATILTSAMAFGLYDHGLVGVVEGGKRLTMVRAKETILASGAIERPLLFPNNDKPGVMLADAALTYLRRFAVLPGECVAIATANDSPAELAMALREAGASVTWIDPRPLSQIKAPDGIEVLAQSQIAQVLGAKRVEGVVLASGQKLSCDLIASAGGWQPTLHLYCQAKGKPRWDEKIGALVPGAPVEGLQVVGAAKGTWDLAKALSEGHAAGGGTGRAPSAAAQDLQWNSAPILPQAPGRIWVDLQHDVTVKDLKLAIRENFHSVEHLKRYTTLGMATDQGKTSNVNGLAVLAASTDRALDDVGVTTYRPPYAPVSMAALVGLNRDQLHTPIRRLPAELEHRKDGAHFRDYGILRPAWYGSDEKTAIARECKAAREAVAVLDGSPLGKIEVIGPDAPAFMDFLFLTRMSTLKLGKLRYGFLLTEGGAVFDDGVVLRLADDRFVVSSSSSHVAAVTAHFEEWRQDRFKLDRVVIHDTTGNWATFAVAGPKSKALVAELSLGIDLDDQMLPHMAMAEGRYEGRPARIARVSFVGERSYEISVPAKLAGKLWREIRKLGAEPLGIEALSILRAEKGYILVGVDTDGETLPHDIGFGAARDKRQDSYVGDRSLFTQRAKRNDRPQLVGIASTEVIPTGAHAVEKTASGERSIGFISTSVLSPTLNRPIALALIERGQSRLGEELSFEYLGRRLKGTIQPTCFYDPEGTRLHV